jgi:lysyl-tRNA synthetase class 2
VTSVTADWLPRASIPAIHARAALYREIRAFFDQRRVLEVETPLLSAAAVTDPHLASVPATLADGLPRYLQTSPELAMKRLLAAGSGPIWQLAKVFRDGERGRRHHPEFTLLEWYRPGFDDRDLAAEVDMLLRTTLGTAPAQCTTYAGVFRELLDLDALADPPQVLFDRLVALGFAPPTWESRDDLLSFAMAAAIEPKLGCGRPTVVFDWPASQAALAQLDPLDSRVARRFEVFVEGVELANGFFELGDAAEQRARFEADLSWRRAHGLAEPPVDKNFLAALEVGLPSCAGVALGIDRLLMLRLGLTSIDEVLAFPVERA